MKIFPFFLAGFFLLSFFSCSSEGAPGTEQHSAAEPAPDAAPPPPQAKRGPGHDEAAPAEQPDVFDPFHSAAAVVGGIDSLKKFIRTADVRFRTSDALRATLEIESLVQRHGGFVTSDNLLTAIEHRRTEAISRDSALETTRYRRHAQLVVRVPYRRLDTLLRDVGRLAEFFDHRRVQAEDISFRLIEEQLAQARQQIHQRQVQRVVDDPGRQRENILEAADRQLQSRAAEDQARLERLRIDDAVRFSTLTLDVYEQPRIAQVRVANPDAAVAGTPFGVRAAAALQSGWELLESLAVGILHLWSLLLLGAVAYFLIRRYGRRSALWTRRRAAAAAEDPAAAK